MLVSAGQLPIVSTKATTGRENSGLTFGRENHVIDGQVTCEIIQSAASAVDTLSLFLSLFLSHQFHDASNSETDPVCNSDMCASEFFPACNLLVFNLKKIRSQH